MEGACTIHTLVGRKSEVFILFFSKGLDHAGCSAAWQSFCTVQCSCLNITMSGRLEEGAVVLDKPFDFSVVEISPSFLQANRAYDSQSQLPAPKAGELQRCWDSPGINRGWKL